MAEEGLYGQELAEVTTPEQSIMRLAESGATPETLGKFMDLQERWEANRAAEGFADALASFQARCPRIHKGRRVGMGGGGFTYAGFDDIMAVVGPILRDCNLTVTFDTEPGDGCVRATCHIRHGRHRESSSVTIPVPDLKVNQSQRAGAAFSYAKRYALQNALNIVVTDEDVDAEGLVETITEEQADTIDNMLQESGADRKAFLKWVGAESIREMPAIRYGHAMTKLRAKLKEARK